MIELGPVNFHIVARNETERRIAHYHVRTARLLLGQLKAVAGNVGLQSRKMRTEDGTEITVMRNMNPYTGQAVCSASIRPRSGGGAIRATARGRGAFMWIGLRDNRPRGTYEIWAPRDMYPVFMAIWEPGTPDAPIHADTPRGPMGGQVLIPNSGIYWEPRPIPDSIGFADPQHLFKGDAGTADAMAVAFDPWREIQIQEAELQRFIVATNSGLLGYFGVSDPTDPSSNVLWKQAFVLDPGPNGSVRVDPPDAAVAHPDISWPSRDESEDHLVSPQSDRALLRGVVLPGDYMVKVGVWGPWSSVVSNIDYTLANYSHLNNSPHSFPVFAGASVTVKIVTGRGDALSIQQFDFDLKVPTKHPTTFGFRTFPGHFSGVLHNPGGDLGLGHYGFPHHSWGEDHGNAPGINSSLSQYEAATFVINPHGGAARRTDIQPWGIG